jgi:hypothetical protein
MAQRRRSRIPQFPPEFLQHLDLRFFVGHDPLRLGVLGLQLLQPLDLSALSSRTEPPAMVSRLVDLQLRPQDLLALTSSRSVSRSLRMI